MQKIAIVGAGIAGLTAAFFLKGFANVTVFDKSRGVSGRMSTRRFGDYSFDHGAQYFTARSNIFKNFLKISKINNIIKRWDANFVEIDRTVITSKREWMNEEPRYVGIPGMNEVAKVLADGIDVRLNTIITKIIYGDGWQLQDQHDNLYDDFDFVIIAVPSAQALDLLPAHFKYISNISDIKMTPCFALMLGLNKQKLSLTYDCARINNSDLSWISINSQKPNRNGNTTIVAHSTEEFANRFSNFNESDLINYLTHKVTELLNIRYDDVEYKSLHYWKFANNVIKDVDNPVFIDNTNRIALCGDWCLGGRVEGAFMSAYKVVEKIKNLN